MKLRQPLWPPELIRPRWHIKKDTVVEKTLFEKYGGFSTISRVVMSFYDRMLDDDDVGPFFEDVDLPKLIWVELGNQLF